MGGDATGDQLEVTGRKGKAFGISLSHRKSGQLLIPGQGTSRGHHREGQVGGNDLADVGRQAMSGMAGGSCHVENTPLRPEREQFDQALQAGPSGMDLATGIGCRFVAKLLLDTLLLSIGHRFSPRLRSSAQASLRREM
jgi:hypothetical protein